MINNQHSSSLSSTQISRTLQTMQQQQYTPTLNSLHSYHPLGPPTISMSSSVPPSMSISSSSSSTNNKESFDNFNNVDPQAKKAFDHANNIIENSNQDKTFSVFSIPPREALSYYLGVEEHYQREQIKPVCPLCMRQVHFSALSKHVVSCAEYRNSLLAMEESPPIKSTTTSPFMPPPSLYSSSMDYNNSNSLYPLLGKRTKLDSDNLLGGSNNMTSNNSLLMNSGLPQYNF
ncbi:hypothetical protein NAEGRDRAFT_79991 [Naegleria gruberi]|uniref:Uncharacterized protein n=1 Tax=Naegleria gruberi TaxID=5762 RepID=D2VHJ6_NAEGR|nr:uncharacterized protein NAEGRDRAFT_79991 [Naegleria gruberi]EFC43599.1 hypothetical protein NAEGRDRAFT_79991 [Naegleria gruberi]|eukprot:XP_002676343.1 hypothetical protein NAEGRDRAFT_79991 [Naegleria gruberi strain NEG-M]